MANNTYDDLGQLIVKNVGNNAANPLQKVHYSYNIRGWLTGINNVVNLQKDTDPVDLFAFKINYDQVEANANYAKALYNGNIAETYWRTGEDLVKRSYGYQYDQLNRLSEATYQTPDLADNKNYFGESMDYDKNGNITRLQRQYMAGVSSNPYVGDMDILGYFYETSSNRLMKVTDATNQPQGFKDDSNGSNDSAEDYAYDLNGNLIKDENKNITEIQYNQLNLPKKITFGTNGTIEYIYNGTGQKLEKIVKDKDGVVTTTNYLGGFQYRYSEGQSTPVDPGGGGGDPEPPTPDDPGNTDPPIDGYDPVPKDPPAEASRFGAFTAQSSSQAALVRPTLQFFPTAEGYYDYIYKKYVYQYKDHLGNIRLSYAKNPATQVLTIIDENNYYPFGLKHKGYNTDDLRPDYKYKYNGKELQDESIGGNQLNLYDYGARNYDPAIGRWMNIDPLAEKYSSWSGYNYALNNPVLFVDPDGKEIKLGDLMKDKEHANAFMLFAKTKEGKAFLDLFASKGQKLTYGGKVFYEAGKAGKFDEKGVNLNYSISKDEDRGQSTTTYEYALRSDHELDINVAVAKDGYGSKNKTLNLVKAIAHESFLHADSFANDYGDDANMNYSNLPSGYRKYGDEADHYNTSLQNLKDPSSSASKSFAERTVSVLRQASSSLNLNMSNTQLKTMMWNFSGSLIQVNPKTGNLSYKK